MASPYLGIGHDAVYYAADALRHLHPLNFEREIFFAPGNQGQYSIFGWCYAHLIAALGLNMAAWLSTTLARLLWLVAACCLARAVWTQPSQWAMPLALMLLLPTTYDGLHKFSVAEAFATPRCWSEALVLLALAAWARQRHRLSLVALLLATLVHPLMSLVGWATLLWCQPPRPRWAWLAVGALGLAAGAWLQIGPLAALFQSYDSDWWLVVESRNAHIMPGSWDALAWVKSFSWVTLLWFSSLRSQEPTVKVLARSLAVVLLLSLCAWILSAHLHWVLPTQLQLWRSLWLAQLLAPALWVSTLKPVREWDSMDFCHAMLVLAAGLSVVWQATLLQALAFALYLPAAKSKLTSLTVRHGLSVLCAALVLANLPSRLEAAYTAQHFYAFYNAHFPLLAAWSGEPLVTLGLISAVYFLFRHQSVRINQGVALMAAGCFSVGLATSLVVDGLTASRPNADRQALQAIFPAQAVILWAGQGAPETWLSLQRSHYASRTQGAGALFSRVGSLELQRRLQHLGAITGSQKTSIFSEDDADAPALTEQQVPSACTDVSLDFVILNGHVPSAHWIKPMPPDHTEVSVFECSRLRHPPSRPSS